MSINNLFVESKALVNACEIYTHLFISIRIIVFAIIVFLNFDKILKKNVLFTFIIEKIS